MAPPTAPPAGALPTSLVCAGCGHRPAADDAFRLGCPAAREGDDVDHVLRRELDPARLAFPEDDDPNPFVRYRTLLHGYHAALARGWTDEGVVSLVRRLDDEVAAIDGHGFRITPLLAGSRLDAALGFRSGGGVLVKDETGNVSGSHKARHLFGTLLELELAAVPRQTELAIASCGNAALAAAVVASAAGRPLRVFVPADADPVVLARLGELGARVEVCERPAGVSGDPTVGRLREALAAGALPFTCQGSLNGLAIEGGETLGWELADQVRTSGRDVDRIVIQVGGGALASSVAQALAEIHALGALSALPRLDTVQTRGAFPLLRAHRRVAAHLVARLGLPDDAPGTLRTAMASPQAREELGWIARHRSRFMWPWETEPRSVAGGIIDDETYDWLAVVTAMLETGGEPIVVDEETLVAANALGVDATGIDVDATGSAGLAGLVALAGQGAIGPRETVAVLFTGIRRRPAAAGPHPSTTATE